MMLRAAIVDFGTDIGAIPGAGHDPVQPAQRGQDDGGAGLQADHAPRSSVGSHVLPSYRPSVFWRAGFYTIAGHPLQSRGGFQSIMFIHMFAFRWKAGVTEEQKQRVIAEIRKLQGQIPGLVETSSAPTLHRADKASNWVA